MSAGLLAQHGLHTYSIDGPAHQQEPALTSTAPACTSKGCGSLLSTAMCLTLTALLQRSVQAGHSSEGLLSPLLSEQPWGPQGTPSTQSLLSPMVCIFLPWHWAAYLFQDENLRFSVGWLSPRGASERASKPVVAVLSPQLDRLEHSCKGQGDTSQVTTAAPGLAASSSLSQTAGIILPFSSSQAFIFLHTSTLTFPCHSPVSLHLVPS